MDYYLRPYFIIFPYIDDGAEYVHHFGKIAQANVKILRHQVDSHIGFSWSIFLPFCRHYVPGKKNTGEKSVAGKTIGAANGIMILSL